MNDFDEFCRSIPKIELHAHLNGCIRSSTFRQLLSSSVDREKLDQLNKQNPLLTDCHQRMVNVFEKFALLRSCVTNLETIERITRETIEDFLDDRVIYAEIRTRPRTFDNERIPMSSYVETIVKTMKNYEDQIRCRLILSIDRSQTIEQAMETLKLAEEFRSSIVGLDLCGDPNVKSFKRLRPIFQLAKQMNFSTTIHIGELPDDECLKENDEILDFRPTRLGHFNFRRRDQEELVIREKIPLEICPTSNLITMNLSNLNLHHFKEFYSQQHPLAICTDDSGLMNCSLSSEMSDLGKAFHLNEKEIFQLMRRTSSLIFDQSQRKFCQTEFEKFLDQR